MRVIVLVILVISLLGANGSVIGKRAKRGSNTSVFGSERGGGSGSESGGGYYNRGSDERDANGSREGDGCGGDNFENRGSSYGRDDYNEKRHGGGSSRNRQTADSRYLV